MYVCQFAGDIEEISKEIKFKTKRYKMKNNIQEILERMTTRVSGIATRADREIRKFKLFPDNVRTSFKVHRVERKKHKKDFGDYIENAVEGIRVGFDRKDIKLRKAVQRARQGGVVIC